MHELPSDLTSSLRSYRGSVYGGRNSGQQPDVSELEKGGHDDDGNKEYGSPDGHRRQSSVDSEQDQLLEKPSDNRAQPPQQQRQPSTQRNDWADRFEKTDWDPSGTRDSTTNKAVTIKQPVPPTTPTTKQSIFNEPQVADPDPVAARVADNNEPLSRDHFFELMGMRPPENALTEPRHLALPHGLYGRVLHTMETTQAKYRMFDAVAYALLTLQLILSALFIVLGSLSSTNTHVPTAVLGAISTVIAGSLAMMKGQGLPNRLRQTRDAMRNVVFEAEELYQDFQADQPILFRDIRKIREDYLRVMEEARRNHPDTWNQTSNAIAAGIGAGGGRKSGTQAARTS